MKRLVSIFSHVQQVPLSAGCEAFQDGAEKVYPGAHVNHSTLVVIYHTHEVSKLVDVFKAHNW